MCSICPGNYTALLSFSQIIAPSLDLTLPFDRVVKNRWDWTRSRIPLHSPYRDARSDVMSTRENLRMPLTVPLPRTIIRIRGCPPHVHGARRQRTNALKCTSHPAICISTALEALQGRLRQDWDIRSTRLNNPEERTGDREGEDQWQSGGDYVPDPVVDEGRDVQPSDQEA